MTHSIYHAKKIKSKFNKEKRKIPLKMKSKKKKKKERLLFTENCFFSSPNMGRIFN